MRISDWSSDVCSSDLLPIDSVLAGRLAAAGYILQMNLSYLFITYDYESHPAAIAGLSRRRRPRQLQRGRRTPAPVAAGPVGHDPQAGSGAARAAVDRQSGVWGKRVAGRVDHGGRRTVTRKSLLAEG